MNQFFKASRIESLEQRVLFGAGDLDATFGANGLLHVDFGSTITISKIAVQADSKIVVAGTTGTISSGGNITNGDFFLARYNVDGSLDTTFGNNGTIHTDFGGNDLAADMRIDSQGRIVVAGTGGPNVDFAVARYTSGGVLDIDFGTGGKGLCHLAGMTGRNFSALTSSDKILLVGSGSIAGLFAAARLDADGSFDTSFGGDGTETLTFPADESGFNLQVSFISAISETADGKLFFAGNLSAGDVERPFVARLLQNGSLDPAIGIDAIGSDDTSARDIAALPDGRAILTASDQIDSLYGLTYLIGDDGSISNADNIPTVYNATNVLAQPDGNVVVAGASIIDLGDAGGLVFDGVFLARAGINGSGNVTLDNMFGHDGVSQTYFSSAATPDVISSALDSAGKIVVLNGNYGVANGTNPNAGQYTIARFDGTGSIHTTPFASLTSHGTLVVSGTSGADQIIISAATQFDIEVDRNGVRLDFTAEEIHRLSIEAGEGNDSVSVQVKRPSTILGGNGNDKIFGGTGADVINGANGNDKIHGGDGSDTIVGGRGHDRLYGDAGDDEIIARDNLRDTLYGGDGADIASIDTKKIKDLLGEIETFV